MERHASSKLLGLHHSLSLASLGVPPLLPECQEVCAKHPAAQTLSSTSHDLTRASSGLPGSKALRAFGPRSPPGSGLLRSLATLRHLLVPLHRLLKRSSATLPLLGLRLLAHPEQEVPATSAVQSSVCTTSPGTSDSHLTLESLRHLPVSIMQESIQFEQSVLLPDKICVQNFFLNQCDSVWPFHEARDVLPCPSA